MVPQQETIEIDDSLLERAVKAYEAVNEIHTELQQELAGVNDQEQIQAEVQEAQAKMVAAVEDADMEVAEYEQVMSQVTQDDNLRQQFIAMLQAED